MTDFQFEPIVQEEVTSLEEARVWAEKNPYKVEELKTDDLRFTDSGALLLGNSASKFSTDGFKRFCRALDLPHRFAMHLKNDLLVHNVNQLLQGHDQKKLYFTSRDDGSGVIVNVSPKEVKSPINHADLLEQFHENGLRVKRIRLSDRGMNMSLSSPNSTVEPAVGDISEIGVSVENSETGFGKTFGQLFLFRLTCSNGAVVPYQFGYAERITSVKLPVEQVISNFFNQLRKMLEGTERIKIALNQLHEMKLREDHFVGIWKNIYYVLSSGVEADKIVGVEEPFRESSILREKARVYSNRAPFNGRVREMKVSADTELSAYQVFNNITRNAQGYRSIQANALEAIGGEMLRLSLFSEN